MGWTLTGGRAPGPDGLHLSDGRIAAAAAPGSRRFDASGLVILPGIIDVHGDGFERNLSPRPGVLFDAETALVETDRQCAANGITTAFLALTISWEPGLRSVETARAVIAALGRMRPRLLTDLRIQLRWEIFALEAAAEVEGWLELDPRPALAFNDHFSGLFQPADPAAANLPEYVSRLARSVPEYAKRSGLPEAAYRALVERVGARADEVEPTVARLAARAAALGAPRLAHDETDAATRRRNRALGVSVSEFPLTREAAEEAVAAGEATVLGAPNVLRGGSHIGALDAEPAARAGLCTALASDYFYPAPLLAAARIAGADLADLPLAWALVSEGPARALGLSDRGRLAPGLRGDVLAVAFAGGRARVEAAFAAGRLVFAAEEGRIS